MLLGLLASLFFEQIDKYKSSKNSVCVAQIEFIATVEDKHKDDKPKCIKISLLSDSVDHLDGCINAGMKMDDCCWVNEWTNGWTEFHFLPPATTKTLILIYFLYFS